MQADSNEDEIAGNRNRETDDVHSPNAARSIGLENAIDSSGLFAGRNEVLIYHAGEIYRLRVTRNGKLILNK